MRCGFSHRAARDETERWIRGVCARSSVTYESHVLTTRFGETHILDSGTSSKPAILFLPGWGTCGAFWDLNNTLEPLAERFRIVLLDLPGQPGLSTSSPLPTTGRGCGDWLGDVLQQLNLRSAHFAGCSFGGFVLLQSAPLLGARMESLFLAAPAGLTAVRPRIGVLPSLLMANLFPTKKRAHDFLNRAILGTRRILSVEVRERLDDIVFHFQKHFRSASLPPLTLGKNHCQSVQVPTTVMCGEQDRMIPPEKLRSAAEEKLKSLVEFVPVRGMGHSLEMSPEVIACMDRFFTRSTAQAA